MGDAVVEEPIHECGACFQCRNGQPNVSQEFSITDIHRDGAYAKYTVVPAEHLHAVPNGVPIELAVSTEPTSVATRAVFTRFQVTPGDRLLAEGPGLIGFLTAMVADSMGADVIVSRLDADEETRLPILRGLDIATANVQAEGFDNRTDAFMDGIVFDTTGHHTGVEMAVEQVRNSGQVVVVGIPVKPSELAMTPVVRGELDVDAYYGSVWRDFERALRLIGIGSIKPEAIVNRRYPSTTPRRRLRPS